MIESGRPKPLPTSSPGMGYGLMLADKIGMSFFAIVVVGGLLFLIFTCYQESKRHCVKWEPIVRIGACNFLGDCGILTENYSGARRMPIVGEKACVEYNF